MEYQTYHQLLWYLSSMSEKKYLILLSQFSEFGPARTKLLVSYFGSARDVWKTPTKGLASIGLKGDIINSFDSYRKSINEKEFFKKIERLSLSVFTQQERYYQKVRKKGNYQKHQKTSHIILTKLLEYLLCKYQKFLLG